MFVVWGQYAGPLELGSNGWNDHKISKNNELLCTANYAKDFEGVKKGDGYNFNLLLQEVSIQSRSSTVTMTTPPPQPTPTMDPVTGGSVEPALYGNYQPLLYGTDAEWITNTITPWLELPCGYPASHWDAHTGWSGGMGTVDYKAIYLQTLLGWMPCYPPKYPDLTYGPHKNPVPAAIDEVYAAAKYLRYDGAAEDDLTVPDIRIGYKYQALLLLRRLHACHRGVAQAQGIGVGADGKADAGCQFSLEDTVRLRDAVIRVSNPVFTENLREDTVGLLRFP